MLILEQVQIEVTPDGPSLGGWDPEVCGTWQEGGDKFGAR
jgi:hypothetical protein